MLNKAEAKDLTPQLRQLMAFAMSEEKVEEEHACYVENPNRYLYLAGNEGIIGIELLPDSRCEIRHIAVSEDSRRSGMGAEMMEETIRRHSPKEIFAETDRDAVAFYRKTGFHIKSLGEKYPGRERFYCAKILPSK